MIHHHVEPVRGSRSYLRLRHLPSCWTSEGLYGTTCASGVIPTNIRWFLLLSFFFPPPTSRVFFCFVCFRVLRFGPGPVCHMPSAQNLIALRPSNYVYACCQNGL